MGPTVVGEASALTYARAWERTTAVSRSKCVCDGAPTLVDQLIDRFTHKLTHQTPLLANVRLISILKSTNRQASIVPPPFPVPVPDDG